MRISDWSSDLCSSDLIIENIDIGGPSMVRSAAKNHEYVAILTDPADYDAFIAELEASGGSTSLELRRRLAARAFAATAAYDAMISQWFAGVDQGEKFPPVRAMASRSEEHTSELQSLIRHSSAV